jgi:hypothetical protein
MPRQIHPSGGASVPQKRNTQLAQQIAAGAANRKSFFRKIRFFKNKIRPEGGSIAIRWLTISC